MVGEVTWSLAKSVFFNLYITNVASSQFKTIQKLSFQGNSTPCSTRAVIQSETVPICRIIMTEGSLAQFRFRAKRVYACTFSSTAQRHSRANKQAGYRKPRR